MAKDQEDNRPADAEDQASEGLSGKAAAKKPLAKEVGGRDGPEPTRYGDWERKGIASDF